MAPLVGQNKLTIGSTDDWEFKRGPTDPVQASVGATDCELQRDCALSRSQGPSSTERSLSAASPRLHSKHVVPLAFRTASLCSLYLFASLSPWPWQAPAVTRRTAVSDRTNLKWIRCKSPDLEWFLKVDPTSDFEVAVLKVRNFARQGMIDHWVRDVLPSAGFSAKLLHHYETH